MIPSGKLHYDQVPPPPTEAARWDGGHPPYAHEGYVLDADLPEGPARWRYRGARLIGFMIYTPDLTGWRSTWFDGQGY